jgi:hypothetical protein
MHAFASSFIRAITLFSGEAWCLNTLVLRSFHIFHEGSMAKEAKAFPVCHGQAQGLSTTP